MGRHRRNAADHMDAEDRETAETVDARLGLDKKVCTSCDTSNPENADTCRKCGRTQFRPKAEEYRGKGSENSGGRGI